MGLDKEGSKGGGYVGGFFHLFDWKAKSRKKLFSSKSDVPAENSKQGKKSDGNLPTTRVYLMDEDESGMWSSARGNADYSCASSVTDEEGCGSRGPNVVARLMGLDSMPTTYSSEPYSTPFFDTQSLRDAEYSRRRDAEYSQNYHQMLYSGDLIMKTEDPIRNHVEPKSLRIANRPIEKFQTEMLPPKSAKTIPITQHKLLSPIKCPGFVPSMNAAHIMEAAARIIESAPQATAVKGKMALQGLSSSTVQLRVRDFKEREGMVQKAHLGGPSSVPLRVRDPKGKVEATQKTASRLPEPSRKQADSDSAAMGYLRGHALNKSLNAGAGASSSFRASADKEESSSVSKNNGRSISLAIQAKVNVQKRELASGERSQLMANQHEQNDNKLSQPFRTQPRVQKNAHKKSSNLTVSGALRQNNQKQNTQIDKEKLPSKSLVSNSRKVLQKPVSKPVGSTKTGSRKLEVFDSDKETSQSNMKNFPRKKRSIEGAPQFEKNKVAADDSLVDRNRKPVQSSSVIQKQFSWAEDSRKKGTDVVSFTFTAPLTRSMMGSESPNLNQSSENRYKRVLSESDNLKLSSVGYNVLGGDDLSKLLEQKLRELTYEVESSSSCNASASLDSISSSAMVFQDSGPTPDTVTSKPRVKANQEQNVLFDNVLGYGNRVISSPLQQLKREFQGPDDMEVDPIMDAKQPFDSRHPSPISVLEPSFVTESCFSSDSMDSEWIEGNKHSTSQAAEILGPSPLRRSYPSEADMDLSDSASSVSIGGAFRKNTTAGTLSESSKSIEWELEYVKEMLSNVELMFKDLSLGRAHSIIHPHHFEQLEAQIGSTGADDVDSRLRRKVLFDCVSECMELRFRRFVGGGYQAWELGLAMVRRKEKLAEDVYREISGWRGLADSMVDNLVGRDMSTQHGKWLEYDSDAFELGVELGGDILDSLIDEAISGILRL